MNRLLFRKLKAEAVEKEDFDKYSDYIEKRARMYGFTKDGEVVFINIAGN